MAKIRLAGNDLWRYKQRVVLTVLLFTLVLNAGCGVMNATYQTAEDIAVAADFDATIVLGELFEHRVYESHLSTLQDTLKIYIEGDGLPWFRGRMPSTDPTPRVPLALRLMAQDPTAAIYIGRPCYFGLHQSANCSPKMWTSARYSAAVIASMNRVVRHYQKKYGARQVVLMGYSGGGAVATLMARDISPPVFLLTLAANLDTDTWTQTKAYLPLHESLNPVNFVAQLQGVGQLHLIAEDDTTVLPAVTQRYTSQFPAHFSRQYPGFDHSCCWLELWPKILRQEPWYKLGHP